MARAAFAYTDDYVGYHFNKNHPLQQVRLQMNYRLLDAYGHFTRGDSDLVAPNPATDDDLLLVHTPEYVNTLRELGTGQSVPNMRTFGFGPGDNPPFRGMYDATLLYVGGTLECVRRILAGENRAAFNNSGGLHHALPNQAAGFCLANDCAIAARVLLRDTLRVVYLDIDAHHGDGVQAIFYDDPRVLTISLHETPETLFPRVTGFAEEIGTGAGLGYNANVPMLAGSTDEHYAYAMESVVTPLITAFDPEVIILQVGADGHFQDRLAHLALTTRGWIGMVETVLGYGKPVVALGGGGYNLKTVARLWTLLQATLAGVTLPDDVPAAYAAEYGITHLHDQEQPPLTDADREAAWAYARESVATVQRLVFPRHGL